MAQRSDNGHSANASAILLNGIFLAEASGSSKPPLGPLCDSRIPALANCCRTLAVNAFGEEVRSVISLRFNRSPRSLASAISVVVRNAYSQALENIAGQNYTDPSIKDKAIRIHRRGVFGLISGPVLERRQAARVRAVFLPYLGKAFLDPTTSIILSKTRSGPWSDMCSRYS